MKITTYCKKCGVARVFSCRAEEKRKNKTGYCRECFLENTPKMSDSPSWNGGTFIRSGYRFIKIPDHPFANNLGYVREHRLVMEKFLGRYLTPKEVVHHKDGNKLNNSVENLASRLGGAAMAFGALGLAAMAVYGIYQFVVERNKKLAEEARKAAEAKAKLRDEMVRSGDAAATDEVYRAAQKRIDSAVSKGVLHKRTAARQKSRLARRVHQPNG